MFVFVKDRNNTIVLTPGSGLDDADVERIKQRVAASVAERAENANKAGQAFVRSVNGGSQNLETNPQQPASSPQPGSEGPVL